MRVDAARLERRDVPRSLTREMRSSVIFLGAMLARLGVAELSYPGGCELGPRPIDLHLAALRALGAEIREEQGVLLARTGPSGLVGREICLSLPSVGATENLMLAACGARGTTAIVGAAREPEIEDLQAFLRRMGAEVSGAGGSVITVEGGHPLHPAQYRVMGDRIAGATCLCAAARRRGRGGADRPGSPDADGGAGLPGAGGVRDTYRPGEDRPGRPGPPAGDRGGAHRPLPRLPHRRPGHFDGRSGGGDRVHPVRGEHVRQPLPPRG